MPAVVLHLPQFESMQGKKAKDPNAPKRPMSAYMIWLNANREKIKSDNPGISIIELSKKAGELWKGMTKEDKEEWDRKAETAKKDYEKAVKVYKESGAAADFDKEDKSEKKSKGKSEKKKPEKADKKPEKSSSKTPPKAVSENFKSKEFVSSDESSSDESGDKKKSEKGSDKDDDEEEEEILSTPPSSGASGSEEE